MQNHFLAWIGSALLGITGLGVLFKKYGMQIVKAIQVSRDALDLLDDLMEAAKDNKITPEEVQKFEDEIKKLKDHLKGA